MNDRFKASFGITLAGAFVLFAGQGKAFGDALLAFPALVAAWSAVLPAGTWSTVLAFVMSVFVWVFCQMWLPRTNHGERPDLAAQAIAILIGIAVTVSQVTIGVPGTASAAEILQALWMGVAAGFAGPFAGLMIRRAAQTRVLPGGGLPHG